MKTNIFSRIKYWILTSFTKKIVLQHKPFIIGIIGEKIDRSLTKKAIFQVLSDKYGEDVYANSNLFDNEQDSIIAILKYQSRVSWLFLLISAYFRTFMKNYPKYIILELGEGDLKQLKNFMKVARLDIAVIADKTNDAEIKLNSIAQLLKPEFKIFKITTLGKTKVSDIPAISISMTDKNADYFATNFSTSKDGIIYRILTRGQNIAIKSKSDSESDLYSQLFAFAVGHQFNIQSLKIKKSLEKLLNKG